MKEKKKDIKEKMIVRKNECVNERTNERPTYLCILGFKLTSGLLLNCLLTNLQRLDKKKQNIVA